MIDYKKLLKRCMEHWLDAEGVCWDGEEYGNNQDCNKLTQEESKAVNNIYKELIKD